MRSPRLAALELRRFGRGRLPRAALVALLLLPLLYGALYLWSFWDPYGRLDRVPVALVNDDRGATADGRRLAAGDDIAEGLRESEVFDWHEVSAAEARRGVEDGTYYLSLTMPADFSRRIASGAGDSPRAGALQVRTNDANNYIVGQISRTVFAEVREAASGKASRAFLDRIFVSFSDIHGETVKAAKGADEIKGGVGKAEKGSKDLAGGLKDAEDGSGDLSEGLKKLDTKAGDLEKGSKRVADGTEKLAGKVNGAADRVGPFLEDNEKTIGETARFVADSSGSAPREPGLPGEEGPGRRRGRPDPGGRAGRGVPDPLRGPGAARRRLPRPGEGPGRRRHRGDGRRRRQRPGHRPREGAEEARQEPGGPGEAGPGLAERAPNLSEDLDDAVKKINELNTGAGKVADGAEKLHKGIGTAKTGAKDLDKGVGKLRTGADDLNGGLFKLVDGSAKLAGGLHDGAGKIPDYDEHERDARTGVMADPVRLASESLHQAPNYGTGFAPYFIPLSLWVGAMVAYMLIPPMNRRALAAGASAWRIALAGWLPVVALGVLQTAALMAVLHWAVGLEMVRAAGTVGFLCLVTACFAAIVQWLNARFGAAGRILVLALLMLQLTSAGGTYPVQTSPGFFNALHPFLPMSYVVEALRRLITGGGTAPVWQACAVLAAFTAAALALTALSARRRQVWTLDRLHPELTL